MMIVEMIYGVGKDITELTLFLRKAEVNDFPQLKTRNAVYMIYGKDNVLLYIGETSSLRPRMNQHLSKGSSKKEINKETVSHIMYAYIKMDRYERHAVEANLVNKYKPLLNATDEMNRAARVSIDKVTELDILFYLRNTDIKDYIIARALKIDREIVTSMRMHGAGNHIELPQNFSPTVKITSEFIAANPIVRKPMDKAIYLKVKELLEEGSLKKVEIAKMVGISSSAVQQIKNVSKKKFKKWEEERLSL